jgi:hypothetical protein
MRNNNLVQALAGILIFSLLYGCSNNQHNDKANDNKAFSIVVIPDTQNSIDYSRQKSAGFSINSNDIFIAQMKDIAKRSKANGGSLAFVTSVGDVWQHQTLRIDPEHTQRGFPKLDAPWVDDAIEITDKTKSIEIPKAIEGYKILSEANIPFGVVPGNHDYDAAWFENEQRAHIGGLTNFLSAFSANSQFFNKKKWYLEGYQGGTSSAQIFTAGGYHFLHFSLEMQASDNVIRWAQKVINANLGLPTIISTHDYLNSHGERKSHPVLDLAAAEPDKHNSPQQLWEKLISTNDQVFMVLSGHQLGQAFRIDSNNYGHQVYQIMANYQSRGQAGIDAGQPLDKAGNPIGIGDGWYRIMEFDLAKSVPDITVSTYSSHYEKYSSELIDYALKYKTQEQPHFTDAQFKAADEFKIMLSDFRQRFAKISR